MLLFSWLYHTISKYIENETNLRYHLSVTQSRALEGVINKFGMLGNTVSCPIRGAFYWILQQMNHNILFRDRKQIKCKSNVGFSKRGRIESNIGFASIPQLHR